MLVRVPWTENDHHSCHVTNNLTWSAKVVQLSLNHNDVIKWKHFPRYWSFVRGIHRSPVNSSHKGQWRGALMFPLICTWINGWVNNRGAGDLRHHRAHYTGIVMWKDTEAHLKTACLFLQFSIVSAAVRASSHIEIQTRNRMVKHVQNWCM